jgi:hypothetical protein
MLQSRQGPSEPTSQRNGTTREGGGGALRISCFDVSPRAHRRRLRSRGRQAREQACEQLSQRDGVESKRESEKGTEGRGRGRGETYGGGDR